ncbi:MAG: DUF2250 domain-containing protein [Candidatus Zixiibacteriota bacterium]
MAHIRVKDDYTIANCCHPTMDDTIIGYYSHTNIIKVHRHDCTNLNKTDSSRLVELSWNDILADEDFTPGDDYASLSEFDFAVLIHHAEYGVDYSNKVAAVLHAGKQDVYDTHTKLRDCALIERVSPKIIQYRKNIVPGKWIKHRNHTYYDLTDKGKKYLEYYLSSR